MHKFTKDIFIASLQIVNYEDKDGHVTYIIKVEGRTKYLIDLN
jgi:hypothetical protein